jgi:hypothetical protein
MSALRIGIDGDVTEIELPATGTLAVTAKACEARLVDVVRLTSQLDMWIDDEGLYNHPVNLVASLLAQRFGRIYQAYHGPVLVTGFNEAGDTVNLTEDQLVGVLRALQDVAA